MIQIALVENSCKSKTKFLEGCKMPAFYMEDFTVLGFPVVALEGVRELLEVEGYSLSPLNGAYQISLENHQKLVELAEFFKENKIDTSLADIADTFYQA